MTPHTCSVCAQPVAQGSRHPACGALVVSVMELADKFRDAGVPSSHRARAKLESTLISALRSAAGVEGRKP